MGDGRAHMYECRDPCGGRADTLQRMLANKRLSCVLHVGKSKEQICKKTISSMSKNAYDTGIKASV